MNAFGGPQPSDLFAELLNNGESLLRILSTSKQACLSGDFRQFDQSFHEARTIVNRVRDLHTTQHRSQYRSPPSPPNQRFAVNRQDDSNPPIPPRPTGAGGPPPETLREGPAEIIILPNGSYESCGTLGRDIEGTGENPRLTSQRNEVEEQSSPRGSETQRERTLLNKIEELSKTNEELRIELASEREAAEDYDSVIKHYRALSNMKAEERESMIQNDSSPQEVRDMEMSELEYMFKAAKMLAMSRKLNEAENAFDEILRRRKELLDDTDVKCEPTREAQIQLCKVLRLQGTAKKLRRAEQCYQGAANWRIEDFEDQTSREWGLLNALNQAVVLFELRDYEVANVHLRLVLPKCRGLSASCMTEIDIGVIRVFELHGQPDNVHRAEPMLRSVCESNEALSPAIVEAIPTLLSCLRESSPYAYAVSCFEIARTTILDDTRLQLGWQLTWPVRQATDFQFAESVLKNILEIADTRTNPNKFQVRALLAHTQLGIGNYDEARENAKIVYNKRAMNRVLDFDECHHADTLIRAIVEGKRCKDKWTDAKKVWDKVYDDAKRLKSVQLDSNKRKQIKYHVDTGLLLANKWKPRTQSWGERKCVEAIKEQARWLRDRLG